eukprot:3361499-Pleurochrysis_carterae.AAC.1
MGKTTLSSKSSWWHVAVAWWRHEAVKIPPPIAAFNIVHFTQIARFCKRVQQAFAHDLALLTVIICRIGTAGQDAFFDIAAIDSSASPIEASVAENRLWSEAYMTGFVMDCCRHMTIHSDMISIWAGLGINFLGLWHDFSLLRSVLGAKMMFSIEFETSRMVRVNGQYLKEKVEARVKPTQKSRFSNIAASLKRESKHRGESGGLNIKL